MSEILEDAGKLFRRAKMHRQSVHQRELATISKDMLARVSETQMHPLKDSYRHVVIAICRHCCFRGKCMCVNTVC